MNTYLDVKAVAEPLLQRLIAAVQWVQAGVIPVRSVLEEEVGTSKYFVMNKAWDLWART